MAAVVEPEADVVAAGAAVVAVVAAGVTGIERTGGIVVVVCWALAGRDRPRINTAETRPSRRKRTEGHSSKRREPPPSEHPNRHLDVPVGQTHPMEIEIRYAPVFAVATVTLAPGESIRAEAGAMMTMTTDMTIETGAQGGFLKSLARSVAGGESFFTNVFNGGAGGGVLQLVTQLPGDIAQLDVQGSIFVQSGSYLASDPSISVDAKWGGARSFFGGVGLVLLSCQGAGKLLVSSYGAIDRFVLEPGQAITVDTGHVVAFADTVQFNVRRVGGLKSTMLSGEGLVVDLSGHGEVFLQTRNLSSLSDWVKAQVPPTSSSD